MSEVNDKIRNPKPPTKRDLLVLEFMNKGNRIDTAKALGLFKTTALRDIIYRLRCAGNIIHHEDVSYKTKDGENKYYRQWFTTDFKIIPKGEIVDDSLVSNVDYTLTSHVNSPNLKDIGFKQGSILFLD